MLKKLIEQDIMSNNLLKSSQSQAKILVVDDEPLIRRVLIKYLLDRNYLIDTAEDGQSALKKLEENAYDLVLTDIKMPNMGGIELLQVMSDNFPDTPKIVLTAYDSYDHIAAALKTGAYDFLTKPITDFTILEHSIERAIERKRLNDEKNKYIDQLKQINEIISMLNSGKTTEDIFNSLYKTLKKIIPFNRLTLTRLQKSSNIVRIKLVASDKKILFPEGNTFNLERSALKPVMESKKFLNLENLEEFLARHPESESTKMLVDEGMRSSLVAPLIISSEIKGFLIFSSENTGAFKQDHVSFLESIAGQIALSVQRGELLTEIEQHTKNLEEMVDHRTNQIIKTQKTTVFALSRLAETRDPETGDHLERIRNYCVLLGKLYKESGSNSDITNRYLQDLYDSSILHDIGKVGIPDGILLKEGFLKDNEFEIMKTHTTIGYDSLKSSTKELEADSFLSMAAAITLYHHERWDGLGYPEGLKGEEIPLVARIIAIADVYDALTTKRPYKEAYSHERAIEVMKKEASRFDPVLFEIFCSHAGEFDKVRKKYEDKELKGN
ncbi:MAG: response regulator [bacterium]|nr:response regulator [bacterium]